MTVGVAGSEIRRFIGFVAAGGAATILNFGVFLALYETGLHYLVASIIGYLSGIAVSYSINLRAVFKDQQASRIALPRYVLAYLVALGLQIVLLELFVRLGSSPQVSNAVAIGIVVVLNFFAMRVWVFRRVSSEG